MPNSLSLEQVQRLKEYKSLLPKERKFIDAFVENGGDPTASCLAAYECKNEASAKAMGYQLMARPRILAVLYLYHDEDKLSLEIFLNHLWKLIERGKISQEEVRAMMLYAEVSGWREVPRRRPSETGQGIPTPTPDQSEADGVIALFEESEPQVS